jgi:hypothetical protein
VARQVLDGIAHARQPGVVRFRDGDAAHLVNRDDEIQRVERVEITLGAGAASNPW